MLGDSDAETARLTPGPFGVRRTRRQLNPSIRLTTWLRRFAIPVTDVIGHAESLSSPCHHEGADAAPPDARGPSARRNGPVSGRALHAALLSASLNRSEPQRRYPRYRHGATRCCMTCRSPV